MLVPASIHDLMTSGAGLQRSLGLPFASAFRASHKLVSYCSVVVDTPSQILPCFVCIALELYGYTKIACLSLLGRLEGKMPCYDWAVFFLFVSDLLRLSELLAARFRQVKTAAGRAKLGRRLGLLRAGYFRILASRDLACPFFRGLRFYEHELGHEPTQVAL
ncbi:hypothetical protein VTK56DRAFT_3849 [Thermocarpiscus australiensis]